MKPKKAIVPRAKPKEKFVPDDTVYLTKSGERVKIVRVKQFPHYGEQGWRKELNERANNKFEAVRISDGYRLWGCKLEDLTPEKK